MPTSPTLTEFEAKLARSLEEAPAEWTPACCSEDTLWDFAEQGGKYPDALNLIRHISSCAYCTQGYLAMKGTLQLRQQLSSSETSEQAAPSPLEKPLPNWQERLHSFLQAFRVRSRLQLGGMALAGAAVMLLLLGPRLKESTRQEALTRQAEKELQVTKQALEKEKQITRQLLASARTENTNRQLESLPTPDTMQMLESLKSHNTTMGASDSAPIQLVYPRGKKVGSLWPVLVWRLQRPISEASKYEISIINSQTQEEHVLARDQANASQQEVAMQIPYSMLKPATKYRWSIEVKDAKGVLLASSSPNEETFFLTPSAAEMGQLGRDYARMGALEDAERALSADLQSASSRRTLQKVRRLRAELKQ